MPGEQWALEGIFTRRRGASELGRCGRRGSASALRRQHGLARGRGARLGVSARGLCHGALQLARRRCERRRAERRSRARPTPIMRPRSPISRRPSPGPILAAGYSFGAAAAVRVARSEPARAAPAARGAAARAARRGRARAVSAAARWSWSAAATRSRPPPSSRSCSATSDRRRLEVIPDADHFFTSGLADISRLAREWLDEGDL